MKIVKLIQYNIWANRLITSQIEPLPQELFEKNLGGSFPSFKATLVHLLESDFLWLNRFKGIPLAVVPEWSTDNARTVSEIWQTIQDEMLSITRTFADKPETMIEFVTRKGQRYSMPLQEIVIHLSHHGSYHRGQLTNMIRMVGEKPVSTDYFLFFLDSQD